MFRHLDLFSGIGGFAFATEMVWGKDVEHVFCDIEPFSQAIIKKHWPHSKIYGDIKEITTDPKGREQFKLAMERQPNKKTTLFGEDSIDLLTGGFPCQPFSAAGRRLGTEDDRHLWPEMLRVIREFKPRWIIGENVGGLVTWSNGLVLEQIHLDLENEGYEVQAFIIPAVSVNAPHRRDRVWIVACNPNSDGLPGRNKKIDATETREPTLSNTKRRYSESQPAVVEDTKHKSEGDEKQRRHDKRPSDKNAADTKSVNGKRRDIRQGETQFRRSNWRSNWPEVAATLCRVDDGIPRRLDRTARLKGLGNAIVPQVAAQIMQVIYDVDNVRISGG